MGVEAGGEGVNTKKHAATLTKGTPGVLHGSMSYLLQDEEGQVIDPHSISAGCAPSQPLRSRGSRRLCCLPCRRARAAAAGFAACPAAAPLRLAGSSSARARARARHARTIAHHTHTSLRPPRAAWTTPASAPSTRSSWTSAAPSTTP